MAPSHAAHDNAVICFRDIVRANPIDVNKAKRRQLGCIRDGRLVKFRATHVAEYIAAHEQVAIPVQGPRASSAKNETAGDTAMSEIEPLMKAEEIAPIPRCDPTTVHRMARSGALGWVPVGRKRLYTARHIEK